MRVPTLPVLVGLVFALVATASPSEPPPHHQLTPQQRAEQPRMRTVRRRAHQAAAPLLRHQPHRRTPDQVRSLADRELIHVRTRYGSNATHPQRRGSAQLTNGNLDSFY